MPRISLEEQYDNRDVIAQIYRMLSKVETGTYKNVDVQDDGQGNLVFTFTDQNDDATTFTIPVKLISTVSSTQAGSTVTMRITWTDGTHTNLSWTAGGDVTTNTNQTISAIKTFSQSPIIPDTPSGTHAAVNVSYVESTVPGTNNLLHKSGNEKKSGTLSLVNNAYQIVDAADTTIATMFTQGDTGLYIRRFNGTNPNYFTELRLINDTTKSELVMLTYKDVGGVATLADYHVIYSYTI